MADSALPDPGVLPEEDAYMSPRQRAFFCRLLLEWRQQLTKDVEKTLVAMTEGESFFPDPADRATLESERNFDLKTSDRERKLMVKIDHALAMIEANAYGFCTECGMEIGLKRLVARPVTPLCIACKTTAERLENAFSLPLDVPLPVPAAG
ncbi:MAG: RNA polymerase-binding protein DksA [Magnetococcales bacterium]|nr:RNA polymerase-binding protein DksA [Magnetococcales bacterium]